MFIGVAGGRHQEPSVRPNPLRVKQAPVAVARFSQIACDNTHHRSKLALGLLSPEDIRFQTDDRQSLIVNQPKWSGCAMLEAGATRG